MERSPNAGEATRQRPMRKAIRTAPDRYRPPRLQQQEVPVSKRTVDVSESQVVETPLATREHAPLAETKSETAQLLAMIDKAISTDKDPGKLLDVYERMMKIRAEQEFKAAFMAFKEECPPIQRRSASDQFTVTRNGVKRAYTFATLEDIEPTIRPVLAKHGLSISWGNSRVTPADVTIPASTKQGEMTLKTFLVEIPCILSHVGGHSEMASATMPVVSKAGASEAQKMGAAETYAMRRSLIKVLGLTTAEDDPDGADPSGSSEKITEDQVANIRHMLDEIRTVDPKFEAGFMDYVGAERVEDIHPEQFRMAMISLEKKRRLGK
jgi:hypothetical protein